MKPRLKILILEDSPNDADLIQRLLRRRKMECEYHVAVDRKTFLHALADFSPDVILSDNSLPQFNSSEALKITRQRLPHIPFILVTGTVSEEFAADIIKSGADDYILKDRMTRLPTAIEAALKHRKAEEEIIMEVAERKEAEESLKSLEKEILVQKVQEQKKITRAIIKAQDKERNHIGQELHDNINQILAAARMYLSAAGDEAAGVKEVVKYPMALIDNSIEEIRLLCQNLVAPLKNIDLEDLLLTLLGILNKGEQTKTNLSYSISEELLSDDLKLNIYRIMKEQINNISKYAEAKHVSVAVETWGKAIHLTVEDDGKGFDPEKKRTGIGISNMINRIESFNGKTALDSSPGNGCKLQISIPL
jgi:signal transduction histidine kinase